MSTIIKLVKKWTGNDVSEEDLKDEQIQSYLSDILNMEIKERNRQLKFGNLVKGDKEDEAIKARLLSEIEEITSILNFEV